MSSDDFYAIRYTPEVKDLPWTITHGMMSDEVGTETVVGRFPTREAAFNMYADFSVRVRIWSSIH